MNAENVTVLITVTAGVESRLPPLTEGLCT